MLKPIGGALSTLQADSALPRTFWKLKEKNTR